MSWIAPDLGPWKWGGGGDGKYSRSPGEGRSRNPGSAQGIKVTLLEQTVKVLATPLSPSLPSGGWTYPLGQKGGGYYS